MGEFQVVINGKEYEIPEEVHNLLLATSKERDTLRGNYASLESDYDVVNQRALEVARRLAELDEEFAEEFQTDEFWSIVRKHAEERREYFA